MVNGEAGSTGGDDLVASLGIELDEDAPGQPGSGPAGTSEAETLLRRVIETVGSAKTMPLSSSVLISRDDVLQLLEEAVQQLPDELRQARWLLRERDEFLARTRREGEELIDAARAAAERMVQRTEVVRQAQATARRAVEDGQSEALRLRHEAEDFCDQKLAAFEIVLDRTAKVVKAGREKLHATPAPIEGGLTEGFEDTGPAPGGGEGEAEGDQRGDVFFDQDLA